jgi:hypothetical protein
MVHIGKEIKKIFGDSGMKISVFANKLNTVPRNIYNIFEKESIDTDKLHKISEILQYDFFRLYFSVKIDRPSIKNDKLFSKSPSKKISVIIEVEEEKVKNQICKLLNIP